MGHSSTGARRARVLARGLGALAVCGTLLLAIDGSAGAAHAETRTLPFKQLHTGETATITFKRNGRYDREGLKQINYMLRDWRRNESTAMDPELLDLIWEVRRAVGSDAPVYVLSGYRSPVTNAMLRSRSSGVAKFSQHMVGKALDFYLPDVPLSKLRKTALKYQRGGVGYYPTSGSPFVHLDTGNVRHWPRMTRSQLAQLFPDGETLHIPTDGKPMSGYDRAMADLKQSAPSVGGTSSGSERRQVALGTARNDPSRLVAASSASRPSTSGSDESDGRSGRNFVAALFNRGEEDDEEASGANERTPQPVPVTQVKPTVVAAREPLKSAPVPRARPDAAVEEIAVADAPVPAPKPTLVAALEPDGPSEQATSDPADTTPQMTVAEAPIPEDKPLTTAGVMTPAVLPRARPLGADSDAIGVLIADNEPGASTRSSGPPDGDPMTATALAATGPVAELPPFAATFTGQQVPLRDGPALVAIDYRPEALSPYMDSDNCLRGETFVDLRHPDQADIGALTTLSGPVVVNTFAVGPQLSYPMRRFTGPAVEPVATRTYEVASRDDDVLTGSVRRAALDPSRTVR